MANEQNLTLMMGKAINSTEKARKLGALGGKKKGENIRIRKTMREIGRAMADCLVTGKNLETIKKTFPALQNKEITKATQLLVAMYKKALSGDVRAFEVFMNAIGESVDTKGGNTINDVKIVFVKESDVNAYQDHVKNIVDGVVENE